MDDGPRCSSRAQHQRYLRAIPTGGVLVEIGREAIGVGVRSPQHAVLEPQRVDGADFSAASSRLSTSRNAFSLLGMVTLLPAKPCSERVETKPENRRGRRRSPRSCRRCHSAPTSSHGFQGEREWAMGCLQTNALCPSTIDGLEARSSFSTLQQWQADNGEMVAVDLVEQLDACPSIWYPPTLVSGFVAHQSEMPPDKARIEARAWSDAPHPHAARSPSPFCTERQRCSVHVPPERWSMAARRFHVVGLRQQFFSPRRGSGRQPTTSASG